MRLNRYGIKVSSKQSQAILDAMKWERRFQAIIGVVVIVVFVSLLVSAILHH